MVKMKAREAHRKGKKCLTSMLVSLGLGATLAAVGTFLKDDVYVKGIGCALMALSTIPFYLATGYEDTIVRETAELNAIRRDKEEETRKKREKQFYRYN
jgi:hypothetical protein